MNEWRKVKLGNYLYIKGRIGWKGLKKSEYLSKSNYRIINAEAISDGKVNWSKTGYITKERYEESPEIMLQNDDILISKDGTIGKIGYIKKLEQKTTVASGIFVIRNNNFEILDTKFIYHFLSSKYFKNFIQTRTEGSVIPHLYQKDFIELEMPFPSLDIQKKISKILSDIDEKIELNSKINDNLEKQAQLIFNNYFFNKNKDYTNYISSNLLEIADFLNGIAMQKYASDSLDKESLPVLKIKELNQGFTDSSSDRCSSKIKSEYIIKNGDIIFSWSGTLLIKIWCGNKCGLNQHLFKVTSKKYDKWFYFLWITYHLKKFISIAKDKATTMGHIKRSDLEKSFVLIPPEKEYESLSKILTPIFKTIISKKEENNYLVNLKNYLLPKLMNGEIDVEKVEL